MREAKSMGFSTSPASSPAAATNSSGVAGLSCDSMVLMASCSCRLYVMRNAAPAPAMARSATSRTTSGQIRFGFSAGAAPSALSEGRSSCITKPFGT